MVLLIISCYFMLLFILSFIKQNKKFSLNSAGNSRGFRKSAKSWIRPTKSEQSASLPGFSPMWNSVGHLDMMYYHLSLNCHYRHVLVLDTILSYLGCTKALFLLTSYHVLSYDLVILSILNMHVFFYLMFLMDVL